MIRSVDGRTVRREKIESDNRAVISIATLPAGVYFVGNMKIGWERFAMTR